MAGSDQVESEPNLGGAVKRGLAWSTLNTAVLRLGTFLTGIVLAHILAPDEFGAYAVALTASAVLINFAEFGMSAYLMRHGEFDERGPTVATVAMGTSLLMFTLMWTTAPVLSRFMGSPEATPVVRFMSLTLILVGLAVVPAADMGRNFLQRKQFAVDAANFLVTTVVTIAMAASGVGAMSLAVGRIAGQATATALAFALVKRVPRFGWDNEIVRPAFWFAVPLASANVVSWLVLTVDNAIVGHVLGPSSLGAYALAFNVATWPMSVIGAPLRAVAMPGFARAADEKSARPDSLARLTWVTASVAMPVGTLLAVLSGPVVEFLYGTRWAPAAAALGGLAVFGGLRVVFDLWVSFMIAHGATRSVMWVQLLWLGVMIPGMTWAVEGHALSGAGWAHVAIGALVTLPAYLYVVHRLSAKPGLVFGYLVLALGGCVPVAIAAHWCASLASSPFLSLALGGTGGAVASLAVTALLWKRVDPVFRRSAAT
jgi:lipopolysaccharide exporter